MSNHEPRDPQEAGEEAVARRVWRQASDELPPPELDAAIIAAARKSVQDRDSAAKTVRDGRRSRAWLMQWQPLAAAATVAGLAFVLLQVMPRDREVIPSIRMEKSAPAPVTARPGPTEPPATERAESAPSTVEAASAEQKTSGQLAGSQGNDVAAAPAGAVADQAPVRSPASPRENAAAPEPTRTEQRIAVPKASVEADRQTTVVPRVTDSGASIAAAAPAPEGRQRDAATMGATEWATRIEALYASGDLAGAADALRAFRAAEPDADSYLPESLVDWARTVR